MKFTVDIDRKHLNLIWLLAVILLGHTLFDIHSAFQKKRNSRKSHETLHSLYAREDRLRLTTWTLTPDPVIQF